MKQIKLESPVTGKVMRTFMDLFDIKEVVSDYDDETDIAYVTIRYNDKDTGE